MSALSALLAFLGHRQEASAAPLALPPAPAAIPVLTVGEMPAPPPLSVADRDVLIRTLWGEARGEGPAGQAAVVHVIRNRVLARRTNAAAECQRPWQFSCWLPDDPNSKRLHALRPDDPVYLALAAVADRAWLEPDTVAGARHYWAPAGMDGGRPPAWAKPPGREVARIGGHRFWAGVA